VCNEAGTRRPAIVATRNELRFTDTANLVPAALFLWALSG
jgi:hypothetical protein